MKPSTLETHKGGHQVSASHVIPNICNRVGAGYDFSPRLKNSLHLLLSLLSLLTLVYLSKHRSDIISSGG